VQLPNLPDREARKPLKLSTAANTAWDKFDGLAREYADVIAERHRVLDVEVPTTEAARREAAVEAVRAGKPIEHGPTLAALRERADRLAHEADVVRQILGERLSTLGEALIAEQPALLAQAVEQFNATPPEDWPARCAAAQLVAWCAGLHIDGDMPVPGPLGEWEAPRGRAGVGAGRLRDPRPRTGRRAARAAGHERGMNSYARVELPIFEPDEADHWFRKLSPMSTPYGPSPAPGTLLDEHDAEPPRRPVRIPAGAQGDPPPPARDDWLRGMPNEVLAFGSATIHTDDYELDDAERAARWRQLLKPPARRPG
jgi:hypothetical protein